MFNAIMVLSMLATPCPLDPPPKVFAQVNCKPGLVRIVCGKQIRCVPPGVETKCPQMATPTPAPKPMPQPPAVTATPPERPTAPEASPPAWSLSVRGETGLTLCGPESVSLAGFTLKNAVIGVQLYTIFDRGHGLKVLWYPVSGLHMDAGILYQPGGHPSVRGVARTWDLSVGTGVDIRISKRLNLVADWTWYRPLVTPTGFGATDVTVGSLSGSSILIGVEAAL